MFTIRQEIFIDFVAILSMKFEYCASCVEHPNSYTHSLVNHEPHFSNLLQNLKATTEGLTQLPANHTACIMINKKHNTSSMAHTTYCRGGDSYRFVSFCIYFTFVVNLLIITEKLKIMLKTPSLVTSFFTPCL